MLGVDTKLYKDLPLLQRRRAEPYFVFLVIRWYNSISWNLWYIQLIYDDTWINIEISPLQRSTWIKTKPDLAGFVSRPITLESALSAGISDLISIGISWLNSVVLREGSYCESHCEPSGASKTCKIEKSWKQKYGHLNIRTFKYTNRYFRLPPGRFSLARSAIQTYGIQFI